MTGKLIVTEFSLERQRRGFRLLLSASESVIHVSSHNNKICGRLQESLQLLDGRYENNESKDKKTF